MRRHYDGQRRLSLGAVELSVMDYGGECLFRTSNHHLVSTVDDRDVSTVRSIDRIQGISRETADSRQSRWLSCRCIHRGRALCSEIQDVRKLQQSSDTPCRKLPDTVARHYQRVRHLAAHY